MKKEILVKKEFLTNSRKKWTLDEDGDDDEEPSAPAEPDIEETLNNPPPGVGDEVEKEPPPKKMEVDEDEEDPLDAFMKSVQAEVRKVNVNVNNGGEEALCNCFVLIRYLSLT